MERCEKCSKWKGEPKTPKVGDKVAFTISKQSGGRRQLSSRVGTLFMIREDGFSVIYRKTIYRTNEVADPSEPSPLMLEFCGVCSCNKED